MLSFVTDRWVSEEKLMILWEEVKNLDLDGVGWRVLFRSVEEHLVRLQLLSRNVLRIELVVHDTVYDLSFAYEARPKYTDPSSMWRSALL